HLVKNRLISDGHGGVRAVATEERIEVPAGLVFRSVGYRGIEIPGLPFDPRTGTVPNQGGRVVDHAGSATPLRGLYVTGWIKRGPHGIIGTNKPDAAETVDHILADAVAGRLAPAASEPAVLDELLGDRGIFVTSWADWQLLDRTETER